MNASSKSPGRVMTAALGLVLVMLAACATAPERPAGADAARARLTELQSDGQLASRAPVAVHEAELAVTAAEQPREDPELAKHLVFMADRRVAIAWAAAQQRQAEDQRKMLTAERDNVRLESRTSEANRARAEAEAARDEAKLARDAASKAQQDAQDLRDEVSDLNAKATERGLLVTLGDVLFDTGKADLKAAQNSNLDKLASFLNRYETRAVGIEGHTDDVGSSDSNYGLSLRRADAVKGYLTSHGVGGDRVTTSGKGESSPVAANDTAFGRQQNRRVEVIISDAATSLR